MRSVLERWFKYWRLHGWSFVVFLFQRIRSDRLTSMAGALAYTTLLSLVPMIAVVFAIISAVPAFNGVQAHLEDLLFSNFVPTATDAIRSQVNRFVANANRTTTIGGIFLLVVAVMLIASVENALNRIWRRTRSRSLIRALPTYWMILTLGPVLVGASLAVSSYIFSLEFFANEALAGIVRFVPVGLSTIAFMLLYLIMPNKRVRISHAFVGALFAGILFELGKRGFALYLASFNSYQAIYGALAAVPILFFWVYISWVIVLFGAEISAALDEYEQENPSPDEEQ
ncbi:virulence factor BrkB family protein [Celerinatantimonas sp. MCCC 1A17872]|uniref:virulence factor BrkB family protein n=1 Tax=Celerinatantimonas sp. MCCC 1A17872 TaxID=3177514 RepID=UPI0038C1C8DF